MEIIHFETQEEFHSAMAVLDDLGIQYLTSFRAIESHGYQLMISDEYAKEAREILIDNNIIVRTSFVGPDI
ncbi:MAG: hypothetical protein PF795_05870 [Kiritimatiellae bacterium]|jgi:hypothetical protein|nr:hypothetical protein [Kiritimatiellia bacterium]